MQFHNFASISEAWGTDMLPAPPARAQKRNRGTKKCKSQPMQAPQYMPAVTNDKDPWCDLYNDGYSHQQVDKIMDMYSPGDDEIAQDTRYAVAAANAIDDDDADDNDVKKSAASVEEMFSGDLHGDGHGRSDVASAAQAKTSPKPAARPAKEQFLSHPDPMQSSSTYVELGIYVVSGIFLIIMMEQFVQIGMNIRSH